MKHKMKGNSYHPLTPSMFDTLVNYRTVSPAAVVLRRGRGLYVRCVMLPGLGPSQSVSSNGPGHWQYYCASLHCQFVFAIIVFSNWQSQETKIDDGSCCENSFPMIIFIQIIIGVSMYVLGGLARLVNCCMLLDDVKEFIKIPSIRDIKSLM